MDISKITILKIWMFQDDHGVHFLKVSNVVSLDFWRYTLWMLGFLNGPKISFKHACLEFSL
jgi:hypothetical protein